jgi:hypothetical protein
VKTESDQARPPRTENGNVVRLPRDWLGPRDELVPLGDVGSTDRTADVPPTAESFWSEDSAALQSAWQPPEVGALAAIARPGRRRGPALVSRVWAPGSRARVIAVASVVAVFAAAALAVSQPGGRSTGARSSHHSSSTLAAETQLTTRRADGVQSATPRKAPARHSHVTRKQPVHRRATHRHAASASKGSTFTSTTAPAVESASSGETQATTPVVTDPTPQHAASTVSADDSSRGHPTGAGAPFAPGYIP